MPCSVWWITSRPPLSNFKEDLLNSGKRNWFDRAERVVAGPRASCRLINPDSVLLADPGSGLAARFALGVCLSSRLIYTLWQQADNLSSLLPLSESHGTVCFCEVLWVLIHTFALTGNQWIVPKKYLHTLFGQTQRTIQKTYYRQCNAVFSKLKTWAGFIF